MNCAVRRHCLNKLIIYFYMFISTLIGERDKSELSRKVLERNKKSETFYPIANIIYLI